MGMSISKMKQILPYGEYVLFQKYFMIYGIGQEAEYVRSANQINVIANYISGAVGGKPPNNTVEDIYPQLSYSDKKCRSSNQLIDWEKIHPQTKLQLIATGLYDEEGNPQGYNPNG